MVITCHVAVLLPVRYEKEQEDIKHIKEFIASCGTYANLVRQAKSKQKILDKVRTDVDFATICCSFN